MFEQVFKNIDDVLWKDAGCATELDYAEQTSWMLFLKYLDDLEKTNEQRAVLQGKKYAYIIDKAHRWSAWAAPKKRDGSFDHDNAKIGDDLIEFVNRDLFPYLQSFRTRAEDANTIEYKIGEIFSEIRNKFQSGYTLRDALELVDALSFKTQEQKHELSHLYEAKLRNMGNAGRNGGEYYTPRPLIRAMIRVVKPKIGERIYDGACGSAGFLCEAFDYLTRDRRKLSTKDLRTLQEKTFYGKEKKSLAYVLGIMNMILHGIEAPNIVHTNTLSEDIRDIQEKDRYDVAFAKIRRSAEKSGRKFNKIFQSAYYRVKNPEVLSNQFIRFIFESADFQSEMAHIAGAGSTRAYIGITKQLDLTISYPPLAEQLKLVSLLADIKQKSYDLQSSYRQKVKSINELKQSFLQKAFSGELTSPPSQAIREAAE